MVIVMIIDGDGSDGDNSDGDSGNGVCTKNNNNTGAIKQWCLW